MLARAVVADELMGHFQWVTLVVGCHTEVMVRALCHHEALGHFIPPDTVGNAEFRGLGSSGGVGA